MLDLPFNVGDIYLGVNKSQRNKYFKFVVLRNLHGEVCYRYIENNNHPASIGREYICSKGDGTGQWPEWDITLDNAKVLTKELYEETKF